MEVGRVAGIHVQVGVVAGVQDAERLTPMRPENREFMHSNPREGFFQMGPKMSGPFPCLMRGSATQEELP